MVVKKVEYSKRFVKSLRKAPRKIQIAFRNRLEILLSDKFNPVLNNHSLSGKYNKYRSINITGDWRAIFKELQDGEIIYFVLINTHSNLYK
jgi:addiction module RelE/StbE family toxin